MKMIPREMLFFILLLKLACLVNAFEKDSACGVTKGCYSDCTHKGCYMLFSWQPDGPDHLIIEIMGEFRSDQNYVAVAFSNDVQMGEDSVIGCIIDGNTVKVKNSYNVNDEENDPITNADLGLTNVSSSNVNGVLTCTARRQKIVNDDKVFNLNEKWHLMLVKGPAEGEELEEHTGPPSVTFYTVDLSELVDVTDVIKNSLIKFHGTLMVLAWIFCASIALVIARFYKPTFGSKEFLGAKLWFSLHRLLMIVAVFCCVLGFMVIFIAIQYWSPMDLEERGGGAHPVLGVIVLGLTLVNPIGALLRCDPNHKFRFIFSWGHWALGHICHILAVLTIAFGVVLNQAKLPMSVCYVVIVYAVYQVAFEIAFEVYEHLQKSKNKLEVAPPTATYQIQDNGSVADSKTDIIASQNDPTENQRLKKIILAVHVAVISMFTLVIIIMIAAL